ncbi:unnamed protein product [Clonostachys rosea f. rosea IK726]|uniref:Uncharacterized protein n=2 Tax=Bionectria ochroleuca TaxID=29856 RepID=A0A0B7JTX6_BIOOC|nr:unnamed protein product [Clonostachys rosea f. rosea IK726]
MDKIPKLRRKPKPPTIETQVDRTSTDTNESFNSTSTAPVSATEGKPRKQPFPRSPFRTFRLRTSGKRARESSPANSSASSSVPPPTDRIPLEGVKVPRNALTTLDVPTERAGKMSEDSHSSDPGPERPSFLDLSRQDIDSKLNELNWDERIRAMAGQRSDNSEWKWGVFKQPDVEEKGLMDRYINIKPWNHNRIKLKVPEGQLDYVNASSITLSSPSDSSRPTLRYIAMQGPTEPSIPYVWRMIVEQVESPIVIVQLTTMVEGGILKCNQYFPDTNDEDSTWTLNEENVWDDGWTAKLTLESTEELAQGTIEKRKFLLQVEGEENPRVVWHFLYLRWPDFGVPAIGDIDSFFELMKLSREHSSPNGPRVIHCSAGVGRTGTFIALEHLIRELDVGGLVSSSPSKLQEAPGLRHRQQQQEQKGDPIFQTVDSLRQQRRGMVQGEFQYRFLYEVMRKLWQDRYGAFPDADEDEDMTDGGVKIKSKTPGSQDPFFDPDKNDDEGDDDDNDDGGGAVVKPSAKTFRS